MKSVIYAICILVKTRDGEHISRVVARFNNRKRAYIAYSALKGIFNVPDVGLKLISNASLPCKVIDEIQPIY